MEVNGQFLAAAALTPGTGPPLPAGWKGRWAPELGIDAVEKENNLAKQGIEPRPSISWSIATLRDISRLSGDIVYFKKLNTVN
jgi:hypothetical protein